LKEGIPIVRSKLIMPQLPKVMAAPERLRRLNAAMQSRSAVFVTAPAGYGKTTLLVNALNERRSRGDRVCWYRLDESDGDLAVFYAHLVEMLFPEEEQGFEEVSRGLADCGDVFARHQYLNALICQELWAWHDRCPDVKTFIAFDDFQHVLNTPEIADAVRFFNDNLPDNCTIVVSSRWSTGLLAGKRMLSRDTLEISRSDLCFSEDEAAAFFEAGYGIIPVHDLLRKIMLHTEGWAAGVILAFQIFSLNGADQTGSFLDRSGSREPFFQYMAAEILKAVDERLMHFLVKVAILPEFTAAEAAAIFDEEQTPELLKQCERQGLFIQKISGRETTYRFHSLFREFLQQIQAQQLAPREVNNYHLKATAYYIEHRLFDQALEHFIACGDVASAAALVARESARLIAFGDLDQLRLWFRLLPDDVVSGSGHLLYVKSFIHLQQDIDGALHLLEQALALFQQTDDIVMQVHTLPQMAHVYVLRNDVQGMRKVSTLTGELAERVQGLPLADLLAVLDFILMSVWEEQLPSGVAVARRLRCLALAGEWQWVLLEWMAVMYILLGDLDQGESLLQETLGLEMVAGSKMLKGYAQMYFLIAHQLQDDTAALSPLLDEMMAIGEKYNYRLILGYGNRVAAIAGYRRHDLDDALERLDESTRAWEALGNQPMANLNRLYRCLWLCSRPCPDLTNRAGQRRNAPQTLIEARKALEALTARPTGMCLQEIGRSIFGAIAREAGDFKLAEKNLVAAVKRSKAKGAKQVLAGACLHLAKLYYDTGNQAGGEDYLRQAFDLAVDNRYVMFWDLHFPTLIEMAARCIRSDIHASYAQALIARYFGTEAAEFLGGTAALTADDHWRDFTGAFIARYGSTPGQGPGASPLPQRARTPAASDEPCAPPISVTLFGRFGIEVNGAAIPDHEWKTRKIVGVLKYLLANRGQAVFREQLLEIFWPEVGCKLASNSLRAALHELRKVLRKYGVPLDGRRPFLSERRDSLMACSDSLLTVDVDAFLASFRELRKLPLNTDSRTQRKIILEKMIVLYQGDFLEKDRYEDWAFAERERLRSIYSGAVMELANIYMAEGDYRKAEELLLQVLTSDQFNEEACLCLLKLYVATNQRSRAARLCSSFVERFEQELGMKPDERLGLAIKD